MKICMKYLPVDPERIDYPTFQPSFPNLPINLNCSIRRVRSHALDSRKKQTSRFETCIRLSYPITSPRLLRSKRYQQLCRSVNRP